MSDTCIEFGNSCKKVNVTSLGVLSGDWYLVDISPLPKKEELKAILSDIESGYDFTVKNGKLKHSKFCSNTNHILSEKVNIIVNDLKSQRFKIAVFDNMDPKLLSGQPLVFVIEPELSYLKFPDHPHINAFSLEKGIPSSLCYTNEPNALGAYTNGDRILDTLLLVTEWLVRHQVWIATRKQSGKGLWIGNHQESSISELDWLYLINPEGQCRCGSKDSYTNCCRKLDIAKLGIINTIAPYNTEKVNMLEKTIRPVLLKKF